MKVAIKKTVGVAMEGSSVGYKLILTVFSRLKSKRLVEGLMLSTRRFAA